MSLEPLFIECTVRLEFIHEKGTFRTSEMVAPFVMLVKVNAEVSNDTQTLT